MTAQPGRGGRGGFKRKRGLTSLKGTVANQAMEWESRRNDLCQGNKGDKLKEET